MRRILIALLILSLVCIVPFACVGCKRDKTVEKYDPSRYTETIDLSGYALVFEDEFNGALDLTIWGDTRQGTRREGFWTKNLAYTDGDGHLILRTEKRGNRYCSDTHERQVAGFNGSRIFATYDDCNPFGMIAGDFGEISGLTAHSEDAVGYVIEGQFDLFAEAFDTFTKSLEVPTDDADRALVIEGDMLASYAPAYDTVTELFNYYSFVVATKKVEFSREKSGVICLNDPLAATVASDLSVSDLIAIVSRLFGFVSATEFAAHAEALADLYGAYRDDLAGGEPVIAALENGCFRTKCGSFVFPLAVQNESAVLPLSVIVDGEDRVWVWIGDLAAARRATNFDATSYSGGTVRNDFYCKNVLFVTGPEGVYSGALRTKDNYTHGFGYYEIRCKLPDVAGIWHAFWLMCGDVYSLDEGSADGIEIDVFEYLPARDAINVALHWNGYDEAHQNAHMRFEDVNCADGEFHTFGMNWDESGYAFYIDGRKVWTSTADGICRAEGYMKLSTEYGEWGDWVGDLELGDLPVDWVIDYVRIYDKK